MKPTARLHCSPPRLPDQRYANDQLVIYTTLTDVTDSSTTVAGSRLLCSAATFGAQCEDRGSAFGELALALSLGRPVFQVAIHDSIREVDASEWDEIVGEGRVFQTHAWLAVLEESGLEDCPPKYFVVRMEDGRIAAHLTSYMIETSLLMLSRGFVKTLVERIRTIAPKFLKSRILECGSPVGLGNPFGLREGIDFADLVGPLCRALDDVSTKAGIRFIVLRDFLDEEMAVFSILEQQGFTRIPNLPTTELQIRWATFDEYLAAMRSNHRYTLRKRLRLAAESNLTSRFQIEFSGKAEQLMLQMSNVNDHAKEYNRQLLVPDFYRGVSAALGRHCQVLEILQEQRLVAHALVIFDGKILRWLFFGREQGGVRDGAYFLAVARIVGLAIEEGMELVDMGLTSYRSKTEFGARMVPLWMYLRIRGVPGRLLPNILRLLNPVGEIQRRDIFKTTAQKPSPDQIGAGSRTNGHSASAGLRRGRSSID